MAPIEIAQQGGASSLYWSHNLVQTTHLGAITSISCSESGMIAIASEDQTISVIHLASLLSSITPQTNLGAQLSASLRATTSAESFVAPTARLHEHTQGIVQLKIAADGRVFSISKDHTLKISDSLSQTRLASFSFPSALTCFALSSNEEVLYVGAQDGNVYKLNLWDIVSRPSHSSSSSVSHTIAGASAAFGANYDWSSSISSSLAEWSAAEAEDVADSAMDTSTGKQVKGALSQGDIEPNAYRGHTQPISSISLSMDGARVITSAMDGTVVIWDERTCQAIHRVSPIKGVGVAWSHLLVRPSSASTNALTKFRLDASSREKAAIPFALVQKSQLAVGAPYGVITVPLGDASASVPSTISTSRFLSMNTQTALTELAAPYQAQNEIYEMGLDLAGRLQESNSSEIENLRQELAKERAMNAKWKEVNNSLFSSTLSSTLK